MVVLFFFQRSLGNIHQFKFKLKYLKYPFEVYVTMNTMYLVSKWIAEIFDLKYQYYRFNQFLWSLFIHFHALNHTFHAVCKRTTLPPKHLDFFKMFVSLVLFFTLITFAMFKNYILNSKLHVSNINLWLTSFHGSWLMTYL